MNFFNQEEKYIHKFKDKKICFTNVKSNPFLEFFFFQWIECKITQKMRKMGDVHPAEVESP